MSITKKFFVSAFVAAFALVAMQANAAYMHSVTLKQGSSGSQVMSLQQTLNQTSCKVAMYGAGAPGYETVTFGSRTTAAVKCFQASQMLAADGVVGPMTAAKLSMVVGGSTPTPTTPAPCPAGYVCTPSGGGTSTGGLSGGAGSLDDVDYISSINDEEVGEGEEDVEIIGLDIEADDGSDLQITSVRVEFEAHAGASGSDDLDDYADEVTLWLGGTQIASADVNDFSENAGVWSESLNVSNAVIDAGESEEFYVAISALSNIDSSDLGANNDWMATVTNIRFRDAQGAFTTDSTTGDLPAGRDFNFVSFSTSADTEFSISKSSDSPDEDIVIVDDEDGEDNVLLLSGEFELEGESDATIESIPVTFTVDSGELVDMVGALILVIDGEEYEADSVATTAGGLAGTITFDDLNFALSAGDTVEFEVRADVNGTDDIGEGATLTASISSDNRSAIDLENEEGDQVDDGDKTGSATGDAQTFRTAGLSVELVDTSSTTNADATLGTYTIEFEVTAVGDDAYIGTGASDYGEALREASAGTTTTGWSAAISNLTDDDVTSGGNWLVQEGETVTIKVQVFATSVTAGAYRAELTSIGWDDDDTDAQLDNSYTSNMDDFETDYEQLL